MDSDDVLQKVQFRTTMARLPENPTDEDMVRNGWVKKDGRWAKHRNSRGWRYYESRKGKRLVGEGTCESRKGKRLVGEGTAPSKERNQDKTRHIGLGTDLAQSALVLANIRTRSNCNQLVINRLL